MVKMLKMTKVATSTNDAAIFQAIPVDKIEGVVTTADACIVHYKQNSFGSVKATITETGNGKAMGEAIMNLLGKGHLAVAEIDATFNGGVTTIAFT